MRCKYDNKLIEIRGYGPDTCKKMVDNHACYDCLFWIEKMEIKDKEYVVRASGEHYMIGDGEGVNGKLGMSGSKYRIKFYDGRVVKTNDLWHQGSIPLRFANKLPDNAEVEAL